MLLTRLRLSNFRNLVDVDLEVPAGVSVFYGENAQGKTALVEAIYVLAIARSFRAENEREIVNFGAASDGDLAIIEGLIDDEEEAGSPRRIIVGYRVSGSDSPGGRGHRVSKEIRVDRVRRSAGELVGLVHAVLFTALDIDLVQGPPSGRRRFLDILISQADPLYLKTLQRYQQVLRQRNRLLRMRREGRATPEEMEYWDGELVKEGAWLTWRRHEVMEILTPSCVRHHKDLIGDGEKLDLHYRPSVPLAECHDGTADNYRELLQLLSAREAATAATAAGPHRDDFDIIVNGLDMGAYASRGQARTLALALRLGEAETLSAVRGREPLLLLDDALSEMDASRRQRVLEKASHYPQVLITTTDPNQVTGFFGAGAFYYRVGEGQVLPLDGVP